MTCSLAVGFALSGSALIYLESLDERGESSYPSAASQESIEKSVGDAGAKARTTPKSRPEQTKPEQTKARGESKVSRERENGSGTRARGARELEAEVRGIVADHPGEYGVLLSQPESETRVAVGAGKRFRSASLAKLPVLLALYREAAEGRLSLDDEITLRPEDVSGGTGALQDYPPGTTMTLRRCSSFLIKESDNTAWAMLERRLGERRIRQELSNLGTVSTNYEYGNNVTSPADVLRMLEAISDPAYTSPALSQEMLASMTDTAFEDWIPRGVPERARIAHKIGILGDSFDDAGIVYPPEGEGDPYYIVVMSKNAGGETEARDAMREISRAAYRALGGPRPPSTRPASGSRVE